MAVSVQMTVCVAIVVLLYATHANSTPQDDLFAAVDKNDLAGLKKALKAGADLNGRGDGGQTALMRAVLRGKATAVKYLLRRGADTSIGEKDGYTPMHGAGFQGRAHIAELLIDHGLDANDFHSDGYAPIHRACWGSEPRHTATVQVLLDRGVSATTKAKNGKMPIELTQNPSTQALLKMHMSDKEL